MKDSKVRQFIQFCVVGVSNTGVYFVVYYALLYCGLHYLWANFLGWAVSVGNAYFWSSRFVFPKSRLPHTKSFLRVYVSYAATLLLGTMGLYASVRYGGISETVAPWLIYAVTVPLNFFLNKYWVFPR